MIPYDMLQATGWVAGWVVICPAGCWSNDTVAGLVHAPISSQHRALVCTNFQLSTVNYHSNSTSRFCFKFEEENNYNYIWSKCDV